MTGRIVKGISGFYYVFVAGSGIYECKAKGAFRKQGLKPLVGDQVEIDVLDEAEHLGNVVRILPRKNALIRPAVANVDQALVIFATDSPKPNLNLLDRFLVMMAYQDVPVQICFNKEDLGSRADKQVLKETYELAGDHRGGQRGDQDTLAGHDDYGGRTVRCWQVVADQWIAGSYPDGDRCHQPEDRAWKTHDQTQ